MDPPQFTFQVRGLLFALAVLALGLAGLRVSSFLLTSLFIWLTIFVVAFHFLAAVVRDGGKRPFHIGFACFGLLYLTVAFLPQFSRLGKYVPSQLFAYAIEYVQPSIYERDGTGAITGMHGIQHDRFIDIGHCLTALFVGVVGGYLATHLASKQSPS